MMHMAPDDVRAMDFEDVAYLAASSAIEADEIKSRTGPESKPGSKTIRLKKR